MPDEVRLCTEPHSAREARQILRQVLARSDWHGDPETAVLLASELATNAIRHGGSLTHFDISASSDCLHVEASDLVLEGPQVLDVGPTATSGRGMALVESLASSWGVRPGKDQGKTVWFELLV